MVPGIGGSKLVSGQDEVWNTSMAVGWQGLLHRKGFVERLLLPEDLGDNAPDERHALQATGLIEGWHLLPGLWAGAGYHRLLQRLRRLPHPERVTPFPYDWRLSIRFSARKLKNMVGQRLSAWREVEPDAMVVFVCHSMGGLVAKEYVEALGGAEVTRRLITIGTPYSGSVKAIKAFVGGLVPAVARIDELLARVVQTMPSVGQLLPTFRCVVRGDKRFRLNEAEIPGIPSAPVRAAFDLRQPTPSGAYPELICIGGRRQATPLALSVVGEKVTYHGDLPDMPEDGLIGDGTVPAFSCVPPGWKSTAPAVFYSTRHSLLQSSDQVINHVLDMINGIDLGQALSPGCELAIDIPDVVQAGIPTPVLVKTTVADVAVRLEVRDVDGRLLIPPSAMRTTDGLSFEDRVTLPDGTWHVRSFVDGLSPLVDVGDIVLAVS